MSTYAQDLDIIVSNIEDVVSNINTYVDSATSASSLAEYDRYVALYDEASAEYQSLLDTYDSTYDSLLRYATFRKVSSTSIDIPDAQNKFEWYAGSSLRNNTFAGGSLYSPTTSPSYNNQIFKSDMNYNMLSGDFSFLNNGLTTIYGFMSNPFVNLLFKDREREIRVFTITVAVVDVETRDVLASSDSEVALYTHHEAKLDDPSSFSNAQIITINKNSWNMLGMVDAASNWSKLGPAGKLALSYSIYDVLNNEEMTLEETLAAGVVGIVKSKFMSALFGPFSIIATAILDEFIEITHGYDIHFGLGGEYAGTYKGEKKYYGKQTILGILDDAWASATDFTDDTSKRDKMLSQIVATYDAPWTGYIVDESGALVPATGGGVDSFPTAFKDANGVFHDTFLDAFKANQEIANKAYQKELNQWYLDEYHGGETPDYGNVTDGGGDFTSTTDDVTYEDLDEDSGGLFS